MNDLARLRTFAEQHGSDNPDLTEWFTKLAKTVAVDFDGVLHPYTDGWCGSVPADEEPMPGACEFLQQLYDEGFTVIVFSTRCDHAEGLAGTVAWLDKHNLLQFITKVTHEKPAAIAYVDDRAVPFRGEFRNCLVDIYDLVRGRPHGAAQAKSEGTTS